jgi:hypothetical protein
MAGVPAMGGRKRTILSMILRNPRAMRNPRKRRTLPFTMPRRRKSQQMMRLSLA